MAAWTKMFTLLGVKAGERQAIMLFIVYSFSLGLATAFFYTPASSLFLQHHARHNLPMGYIVGGLLVFFLSMAVKKQQQRMKLSRLFQFMLIFLFCSTTAIILAYFLLPSLSGLMVFILFAWVRVYMYVLGVVFWYMAGRLFNVRQAKRLFGLIGAGEVLSFMLCFASIPFLLRIPLFDTSFLLVLSPVGLLFSTLIATVIIKKYGPAINRSKTSNQASTTQKWQVLPHKKYFRLIYIMSVFPILALVFVEFLFFAQSQVAFANRGESLSSFLAIIYGLTSMVEFAVKTLLSGKLVERYGLWLGLVALPVLLTFSFVVAALASHVAVLAVLLFPAFVLSRLCLRAFRTSFYDPAFQVLFQPIPHKMRIDIQNKVDGLFKAFGIIFSGGLLWFIMYLGNLALVHIVYVLLLMLFLWIIASSKMYAFYRKSLNNLLWATTHTTKQNAAKLPNETTDNNVYPFVLAYYHETNRAQFLTRLSEALHQAKHQPMAKAFATVYWDYDVGALLQKAKVASKAITMQQERTKLTADFWQEAALSDNTTLRLLTTTVLSEAKQPNAHKLLIGLMLDQNKVVSKAAIRSAANIPCADCWPFLFDCLKHRSKALPAVDAIFGQANGVVAELITFLRKNELDTDVLKVIIPRLEPRRSDEAVAYLRSLVVREHIGIRDAALRVLSVWGDRATRKGRAQIIQLLESEIRGIVKLTHIIEDLKAEAFAKLNQCLLVDIQQKRRNIFHLLFLLYDAKVVQLIHEILEKESLEAKSFALEILDITVEEDVKLLVLPVMEIYDPKAIAEKYKAQYPYKPQGEYYRLNELINSGYFQISTKARMQAIQLVGGLYQKQGELVLRAFCQHPKKYIAEQAQAFVGAQNAAQHSLLNSLQQLERIPVFSALPYDELCALAERTTMHTKSQLLAWDECVLIVLAGRVELMGISVQHGSVCIVKAREGLAVRPVGKACYLLADVCELYIRLQVNTPCIGLWSSNICVYDEAIMQLKNA